MSKNSKNTQRIEAAKTRNRTKGYKGAKSTTPLTTKKRCWYKVNSPTYWKNARKNKTKAEVAK